MYRRAILGALESLHDFQSRSNIDAIRRATQTIIMEEDHCPWSDTFFMKTFKSLVSTSEIEICANINASLSPDYKRKRALSIANRMDDEILVDAPEPPESSTPMAS